MQWLTKMTRIGAVFGQPLIPPSPSEEHCLHWLLHPRNKVHSEVHTPPLHPRPPCPWAHDTAAGEWPCNNTALTLQNHCKGRTYHAAQKIVIIFIYMIRTKWGAWNDYDNNGNKNNKCVALCGNCIQHSMSGVVPHGTFCDTKWQKVTKHCVTGHITQLVHYKHFTSLEILLCHTCVNKWGSERCFIVLFATQCYNPA